MSVYWYLVLAVVIVALGALTRVALSLLSRLGQLASQGRALERRLAETQQVQARVQLLQERLTEVQDRLATVRSRPE